MSDCRFEFAHCVTAAMAENNAATANPRTRPEMDRLQLQLLLELTRSKLRSREMRAAVY